MESLCRYGYLSTWTFVHLGQGEEKDRRIQISRLAPLPFPTSFPFLHFLRKKSLFGLTRQRANWSRPVGFDISSSSSTVHASITFPFFLHCKKISKERKDEFSRPFFCEIAVSEAKNRDQSHRGKKRKSGRRLSAAVCSIHINYKSKKRGGGRGISFRRSQSTVSLFCLSPFGKGGEARVRFFFCRCGLNLKESFLRLKAPLFFAHS